MSKEIDHKIVSMEFDNSKFDKRAEQSISTIDKLKDALSFKGAEKGFARLNQAIKAVTFAPIEKGIDTIYARFTFMERFVIQLYDRMANKIINIGKRMVTESTTKPITSGMSEYELKMGSVQTILASTGESLDTINEKLNELNKYADDTIYSFKDMTSNISKFTNAGVGLEDAVNAIKGVSNVAAHAGANSEEASRAMYNFAQALSAGSVQLVDWKSIVNANMATKSFKEQLMQTAAEMGTLKKQTDGTYKTLKGKSLSATSKFNESLQDQWMTTKVLVKTLNDYASEETEIGKAANAAAKEVKTFSMLLDTLKESLQSGWTDTWELIIGDFNKAKAVWTAVSEEVSGLIDNFNRARNQLLKFWSTMGGRESMLTAFSNIWKNLKNILNAVRLAFRDVFPKKTGQQLVDLTRRFEDFTARITLGPNALVRLRKALRGVFSIFGILTDALKAFARVFGPIVRNVLSIAVDLLLKASAAIGEWINKLRLSIKEGQTFETIFGAVGAVLQKLVDILKAVLGGFMNVIGAFRSGGFAAGMDMIVKSFKNMLSSIWTAIKKFNPIKAVKDLGTKLAKTISEWPIGKAIIDLLTKIKNLIINSPIWKACVGVVEWFVGAIQKVINKFRKVDTEPVDEFNNNVKKSFAPLEALKNFLTKIWHGIVAVFQWAASILKPIGKAIANMFSAIFADIRGVVQRSDLTDVGVAAGGAGFGALFLSMATFVRNLASTVKDGRKLVKNVNLVIKNIAKALNAITLLVNAKMIKEIAIAIGILTASIFVLSALPADKIATATAAIVLLFKSLNSVLASFTASAKLQGGKDGLAGVLIGLGSQMLLVAIAIGVLVTNMLILALIPYEPLIKGLSTLVLFIRMLSAEVKRFNVESGSSTAKMAANFIGMGLCLTIITNAIIKMAAAIKLMGAASVVTATGLIIVMFYFMIGMSKILQEIANTRKNEWNTASVAPFLAMTAMVLLITPAIIALATAFSLIRGAIGTDDFVTVTTAIIGLFVAVTAMFTLMVEGVGDAARRAGNHASTIWKAMLSMVPVIAAIAVMLVAMATAMASLSLIDPMKLANAAKIMIDTFVVIGAILIGLAYFSKETNKFSANASKNKTTIKGLDITIDILGGAVGKILAIAALVLAIAAAAKIMAGAEGSLKAALTITGVVAAFIAGLTALGSFSKTAKGLKVMTATMQGLAAAAFLLATALYVAVSAITLLADMTGAEIDRVGDAIHQLAKKINSNGWEIAAAAGKLVGQIVEAAFGAVFSSVVGFFAALFQQVYTLLDEAVKYAPGIINRLAVLIGVVLVGIGNHAVELADKLIAALAKILYAVGAAIIKNSSQIVDAVKKVLEAIGQLIGKTITSWLGIADRSGEQMAESFSMGLGYIVSKLLGLMTGVKVFNTVLLGPLKTLLSLKSASTETGDAAADAIEKVTDVAEEGSNEVEKAVKSTGDAAKSVGNIWTTFGDKIKSGLKKIGGWIKTFASAHHVATGLIAVATVAVGVLKYMENNIDVVGENTRKNAEKMKELAESHQVYLDSVKKQNDEMQSTLSQYNEAKELSGQLGKMIDQNGRIKSGYQDQAQVIVSKLNDALGTSYKLSADRKTIEDETTGAIVKQVDAIDKLIAKREEATAFETASAQNEEDKKKLAEYEKNVLDAKEELESVQRDEDKAATTEAFLKRRVEKIKDVLAKGLKSEYAEEVSAMFAAKKGWTPNLDLDSTTGEIKDKYKLGRYLEEETEHWRNAIKNHSDAAADLRSAQDKYDTAMDELTSTQNRINLFDQWYAAHTLGREEETQKLMMAYTTGLDITNKNAERNLDALSELLKKRDELLKLHALDGVDKTTELKENAKQIALALTTMIGSVPDKLAKEWQRLLDGDIKDAFEVSQALQLYLMNTVGPKLAQSILTGLCSDKGLDINSPSKAIIRIMGFVGEGIGVGVKNILPDAEAAMAAMGAAVVSAYDSGVDSVEPPVIIPVVDDSLVQNGMASINKQVGQYSAGALNGRMTTNLATSIDASKFNINNDKILASMQQMQVEVKSLKDAFAHMAVLIDGRALVGEIAPDMDRAIGQIAVYKSRGG